MTASYEFEITTSWPPTTVAARIGPLWAWDHVEVMSDYPSPGKTIVGLDWHFDAAKEAPAVAAIVFELFSISSEVHYYRCFDTMWDTRDFERPISVPELLTPDFLPAYYDGIQYRYQVAGPPHPVPHIRPRRVTVTAHSTGASSVAEESYFAVYRRDA